jgi:hypothetical protein
MSSTPTGAESIDDEDEIDRVTRTTGLESAYPPKGYDLVPGTCPALGALPGPVACNCTGACRPRLVKRPEPEAAPVDVPAAARAGEPVSDDTPYAEDPVLDVVRRERDQAWAEVERLREGESLTPREPDSWMTEGQLWHHLLEADPSSRRAHLDRLITGCQQVEREQRRADKSEFERDALAKKVARLEALPAKWRRTLDGQLAQQRTPGTRNARAFVESMTADLDRALAGGGSDGE